VQDQTITAKTQDKSDASERLEDEPKVNGVDSEEEDPWKTFAEKRPGWKGYIRVEKNSSKKAKVAAILAKHTFPSPEFQLAPVPEANSILEGRRWKLWHKTIGGSLTNVPEESWLRVTEEKHLEPYGCETYFK
jgi:sulfite oxidase